MNEGDYLLPEEIECPHCRTDLELDEEDRLKANFICPQCNTEITEKDFLKLHSERKKTESVLKNTKKSLMILAVLSLIIATFTSSEGGIPSILGAAVGLLVVSILLAAIPLVVYKLLGKEMNSEQFISTIFVAWVIVIILQFIARFGA